MRSETNGWDESAAAWLQEMGENGDYARVHVLDRPMLARIAGRGFATALDVGCGEGRFCRLMESLGLSTIGVDPAAALIERARALDPAGDYRVARAETMDVPEATVDLVVCYLSLIDIDDLIGAVARMTAALRPGGTLLVANLTGMNTAGPPGGGWMTGPDGRLWFGIDRYLEERAEWVSWRGMRIRNWHRPLSAYVAAFLAHGLILTHFAEPAPTGGDPARRERYTRVPLFNIMEWRKAQA
jgi:SAM-dependent methyltransferase